MATKQELIELLEAEISRAKTVVKDLQDREESLRQEILQEELDNLEEYINESEVKVSNIKLAAEDAWEDLRRDADEFMIKLKEVIDNLLGKSK